MMSAFSQAPYAIRRAEEAETNLLAYLRLASLVSLEMPDHPLQAIRAVMDSLPDVDAPLVASGHYFVADNSGELIAGAGWSVLPLSFRGQDLVNNADPHGTAWLVKIRLSTPDEVKNLLPADEYRSYVGA